jgi:hypothetical protein
VLAVLPLQVVDEVDTSAQTVVVSETPLEDPVTVMLYAPSVVEDAVVAVNVAVIADVLLMSTDVGERLHVAGLLAPVGALTVQLRSTVPVKELDGVTVMVEVLPDVAPGLMVMLPLLVRV